MNTHPVAKINWPQCQAAQPAAAYYGELLSRLRCLGNGARPLHTIGITSCGRREGVSTVARNLAVAAALDAPDQQVLLVDASGPLAAGQTASSVFLKWRGWKETIKASSVPNLCLLPADEPESAVAAASEPASLADLLTELKNAFRWVVFDLPPVGQAGPTLSVSQKLDGVLLVVEAERVLWEAARRVQQLLAESNVHLLGAVLNKRQDHVPNWLYHRL